MIAVVSNNSAFAWKWLTENFDIRFRNNTLRWCQDKDGKTYQIVCTPAEARAYEFEAFIVAPDYNDTLSEVKLRVRK